MTQETPPNPPLTTPPEGYPDPGPDLFREVTVFDAPAVPTAVVRATGVVMAEAPALFDSVFGTAFPAAFAEGMVPVGAAFALFTRIDDSPVGIADLEIGFPLARPLGAPIEVDGTRVEASELPAGRVAVVSHLGGYDSLGEAWGRFTGAISGMGQSPRIPFWEVYVTEPRPDMDPATLRTDLFCRIDHPTDAA